MDNQTSQEMIAIAKQHNSEIMPKEIFSQIMSLLDLPTLSAWATTCSQFGVKQISIHIVNNCVRSYAQNDGKTFNTTGFVNLSREWIKRISRCSVKSQIPETFYDSIKCYDSKVINRAFLLAIVSRDIKKVRFILNFCSSKIIKMRFSEFDEIIADCSIDYDIRDTVYTKLFEFTDWMRTTYNEYRGIEDGACGDEQYILNALLAIPLIFGTPEMIGVCFNWITYLITEKPVARVYSLINLAFSDFGLTERHSMRQGCDSYFSDDIMTGTLDEYVNSYVPKFNQKLAFIKSDVLA